MTSTALPESDSAGNENDTSARRQHMVESLSWAFCDAFQLLQVRARAGVWCMVPYFRAGHVQVLRTFMQRRVWRQCAGTAADAAAAHLKSFPLLRTEFVAARKLWIQLKDRVSEMDELDMALIRIHVVHPSEEIPDHERHFKLRTHQVTACSLRWRCSVAAVLTAVWARRWHPCGASWSWIAPCLKTTLSAREAS